MDKISTAHDNLGWIATDSKGNTARASFDEGEQVAIQRLTRLANDEVSLDHAIDDIVQ